MVPRESSVGVLLRHSIEFDECPYCDRADSGSGMLGRDRDRFVEIAGEDQVVAAEELAGFGERAVGDEASPFADADAGGGRDGMQRRRADVLAAGVELVCEFRRFLLSGSRTRICEAWEIPARSLWVEWVAKIIDSSGCGRSRPIACMSL